MDKLTGMDEEASGPVGMAEIAALAGVAVSTVSRALSGAAGVSAPRRAKILDQPHPSPIPGAYLMRR